MLMSRRSCCIASHTRTQTTYICAFAACYMCNTTTCCALLWCVCSCCLDVGCSSQPPTQTGGTWNCTPPLQPDQSCIGPCNDMANYVGMLAATCGQRGEWNVTSRCASRELLTSHSTCCLFMVPLEMLFDVENDVPCIRLL
jgi:hypothetical protein